MHSTCPTYVGCFAPARVKSVDVTSTDTAVSDLDIDICLFERLYVREFMPHHFAFVGIGIKPHPSFELVIFLRRGDHFCDGVCDVVIGRVVRNVMEWF